MAEQDNDTADSTEGDSPAVSERGDRSGTRYPYYNLEDAYGFARSVQEVGGSEAREDDLLAHFKVSKTTKTWIYRLSSAREFGLVERKGQKADARISITSLGSRLLMPGDQNELAATRLAAFLTPALYQKLFERYKGAPVPPTVFLKGLLVREHKILESVSEAAAEAFVSSAKYAGLVNEKNAFSHTASPGATAPAGAAATPKSDERADETPGQDKAATQRIVVPADYIVYKCKISRGRILEIPLPRDFTGKDVERLTAFLGTQVDDEETT